MSLLKRPDKVKVRMIFFITINRLFRIRNIRLVFVIVNLSFLLSFLMLIEGRLGYVRLVFFL